MRLQNPDQKQKNMIRTVVAVVDDMFFVSKIRETGKAAGVVVKFPRTLEALRATIHDETPSLMIVDLHNRKIDPFDLAKQLRADERVKTIPMIGFFSHVQTDLQKQAITAGYDQVLPRSLFARDLAKLLAGDAVNSGLESAGV